MFLGDTRKRGSSLVFAYEAKGLDPPARLLLRQQRSQPVADALHGWLSEQRLRLVKADATASLPARRWRTPNRRPRWRRRSPDSAYLKSARCVRGTLTLRTPIWVFFVGWVLVSTTRWLR